MSAVMDAVEFRSFSKMARLSREVIVTEKLDGTNAQVCIGDDGEFRVGSRNRWITPDDDNYGFAAWAYAHRDELMGLGAGRHFGEWWGLGIQRNYGLKEKRFSMFNVQRWALHETELKRIETGDPRIVKMQDVLPACCGLVPVLHRGPFETPVIDGWLAHLRIFGSQAAPDFMDPEGIVVFHVAANVGFKKTLGHDGHKGAAS